MREILFRGYNLETKTWYMGMLGKFNDKYYIDNGHGIKAFVVEDSIGQFTGAFDKNGKKIFDGDIIKYCEGKEHKMIVDWGYLEWVVKNKKMELIDSLNQYVTTRYAKVIGNVYEEKL